MNPRNLDKRILDNNWTEFDGIQCYMLFVVCIGKILTLGNRSRSSSDRDDWGRTRRTCPRSRVCTSWPLWTPCWPSRRESARRCKISVRCVLWSWSCISKTIDCIWFRICWSWRARPCRLYLSNWRIANCDGHWGISAPALCRRGLSALPASRRLSVDLFVHT